MAAATEAFSALMRPFAQAHRDEHGPGIFYTSFQTQQAADAFAAAPVMRSNMFYFDQERCRVLAMPDGALGAVAAGRADVVVVLDVFQAGKRYYTDSRNAVHSETVEFGFVPIETSPKTGDFVPDDVSEWVERTVQAAAKPSDKKGTIYYVQMAQNYDMQQPFFLEIVPPEDARLEIAGMEAAMGGETASTSMQQLLKLSADCKDGQGVIWLRCEGDTRGDIAWMYTFMRQ